MTQLVSRRCPTVEAKNCLQPSLCGVRCGHSGTGTGFLPCTVAASCQCHFTDIP